MFATFISCTREGGNPIEVRIAPWQVTAIEGVDKNITLIRLSSRTMVHVLGTLDEAEEKLMQAAQ